MLKKIFPLFLICLSSLVGEAATIEGTVRAEGKKIPESAKGSGAYASRKFKFADQVDYAAMRDFVVYIEGEFGEKTKPPTAPVRVVTQKDAVFRPHVLPILAGTKVEWPNEDEILHNVFSDSDSAKFDLGLYRDKTPKPIVFGRPGKVDVFCSIHSNMHCIILVLDTPYFAVTDQKNRFQIKDIPPGKYTLKIWHERMPSHSQELIVPKDGKEPIKLDLLMGIKGLPEY